MDSLTNMVCFPKDQFYMVVVLSLVIIGLVLYHVSYVNKQSQAPHQPAEPPGSIDDNLSNGHTSERPRVPIRRVVDDAVDKRVGNLVDARLTDRLRTYDALTPPFRRSPYEHLQPIYTQGGGGSFVQMGYLQKGSLMLPLFGRRVQRNRYEYYVTHQDNPMIKIAVGERNQQELYGGDEINVNGYPGPMKVNLYSVDYPYSPLID